MSTAPTPAELEQLLRAALAVAENAYAPYSHFRVGAAILLETSGQIVTGCNVENASYRLTTCAEQAAIASAVAQHGPRIRIRAVALANLNGAPCQPCGACRQAIFEFSSPDTLILFPGINSRSEQQTISTLLPASFSLNSQLTHLTSPTPDT